MENPNPFELAGQIGELALPAFSEIAKPVMQEFELWFASRLPISPKFQDATEMRCVQHLNLYWQRGYLKGVLMNMFSHCLPDNTFAPTHCWVAKVSRCIKNEFATRQVKSMDMLLKQVVIMRLRLRTPSKK